MNRAVHSGHKVHGKWILAPVEDITQPSDGRVCYADRWWAVTENREVLFFRSYDSPQCNKLKIVAERLGKGFNAPETTLVFINMAFIPPSCES
jgi:hypothetical protein